MDLLILLDVILLLLSATAIIVNLVKSFSSDIQPTQEQDECFVLPSVELACQDVVPPPEQQK